MREQRPSFPFYPKDWLGSASVSAMPLAAQGLYMRLMAFAWLSDGLPADDDALRRLAGVERGEWRKVWPLVEPLWEAREGRLYQRRLEEVRQRSADYAEAKREAGRKGGRSSVEARREANGTAQPQSKAEANGQAEPKPSVAVAVAVPKSSPSLRSEEDEARFARFWAAYPNKEAKKVARQAWNKLRVDDALLAVMLAAIAWQGTTERWQRGIIPHPSTWLNQRRWEDERPVSGGAPDDEAEDDGPWYPSLRDYVPGGPQRDGCARRSPRPDGGQSLADGDRDARGEPS